MIISLPPAPAVVRCAEDAPCWSWSTMGNERRGVVTLGGRRLVVSPCRFRRLSDGGWLRPDPMRGDAAARCEG